MLYHYFMVSVKEHLKCKKTMHILCNHVCTQVTMQETEKKHAHTKFLHRKLQESQCLSF